nr:hypothetical protein GCM10020092_038950 [Actinoplanes digitatis]
MVDEVVSAGRAGEAFEPRHTTHGFRYVQVDGHPGELTPGDVRGVVVHTDLRRTGWFSCGDPRMHRLHEAALWGVRGNVCDIPTDCPQRERAGWTGDWQLFVPTAAFLYDVARLQHQVAAGRGGRPVGRRNRGEHEPVPARRGAGVPGGGAARLGSSWGDAVVIVPWELYRQYADERILAEMWPSDGGLARSRGADGAHRSAPGSRGGPAGARAARAVPLGHRIPLG